MEITILIGAEAAALHQRHRQRIAQHQHQRGGSGWRHTHRAGFARFGQDERHIGGTQQSGFGVAGHADQRNAEALCIGDDVAQFCRLAAIGKHQERVVARERAEIAVAGFTGVDELCRRSGGRQGRGNFASDMPAFAHAAHDNTALHAIEDVHRAAEVAVERAFHVANGIDGVIEDALGRRRVGAALSRLARKHGNGRKTVSGTHRVSYPERVCGLRPRNRHFPALARSPAVADAKFVPEIDQIMGVGGRAFKPQPKSLLNQGNQDVNGRKYRRPTNRQDRALPAPGGNRSRPWRARCALRVPTYCPARP